MEMGQKLFRCLEQVRSKTGFRPKLAVVLGSGLGAFGDCIEVNHIIPYHEIEGFPVSTVSGHKGRFLFGFLEGAPVVVMQGRVHYYEGYSMGDVVLPVRLMGLMGAKAVLLTNAAGGVNYDFSPGDFMLITDHIASFVPSPLIGENISELGVRFPDMSAVYDRELRQTIQDYAQRSGIPLREGVYLQFSGPQFESPAEIRMARSAGADAVGMSTACEAIAARHMGMRVCGISCISNMACGMTDQALSGEEVEETAARVAPAFHRLVSGSVSALNKIL